MCRTRISLPPLLPSRQSLHIIHCLVSSAKNNVPNNETNDNLPNAPPFDCELPRSVWIEAERAERGRPTGHMTRAKSARFARFSHLLRLRYARVQLFRFSRSSTKVSDSLTLFATPLVPAVSSESVCVSLWEVVLNVLARTCPARDIT